MWIRPTLSRCSWPVKPRGVSASAAAGVPAVQSACLRLPWASKDRRWTTTPVRAPLEVAQLVEVVRQVLDHGPGEVGRGTVDQAGLGVEAVIVLGSGLALFGNRGRLAYGGKLSREIRILPSEFKLV